MTARRPGGVTARIRPGLWAGATVGLLTGFCYVFLFAGMDFSGGDPLRSLCALPASAFAVWGALVAAGACAGAVVSLKTPDA